MKRRIQLSFCLLLVVATFGAALMEVQATDAPAKSGYRKPPQAILDVLNAPAAPAVALNPPRTHALLVEAERYPAIAELAAPMLRLAGLRINPNTKGPHRPPRVKSLSVLDLATGKRVPIPLPEGGVSMPAWSPNGQRFAFTLTKNNGIELFAVDLAAPEPKPKLVWLGLNATLGSPFQWMPDSKTLLCHTFDFTKPPPPPAPAEPEGPVIQESYGKQAPVRTLQDLLQNSHDEALFDYYTASALILVDTQTEEKKAIRQEPAIYADVEPSPNGQALLVTRIERPYSYLHTLGSFPKTIEVWDLKGTVVHTVAKLPLQDQIPIEGVPTGPRGVQWRATAPAHLVWTEALDDGDPKKKAPHRDRVFTLDLEGTSGGNSSRAGAELCRTQHRFAGLTWSEDGKTYFYRDFDRDTRKGRLFKASLDQKAQPEPELLFERSTQDRYGDPGSPVMKRLPNGESVVVHKDGAIYLAGPGASPQGDRPFLDRFDLKTKEKKRLFQAKADCYESVVALLDDDGKRLITRHESPTAPPNYFELTLSDGAEPTRRPLTSFKDPTPQLRGITKQIVRYKRPDGVALSFTLYLPPGHQPGTRLPAVVWAYPREFNDPGNAGQVVGSPQRFTSVGGISHLFFLLDGYAVLDDAAMPVVGDPETANDTFVEQIVSSAKAAIDKADEMGVIDPKRVGVGGHSYGAFMTANLLAHSDLFRAGIARSGAYNRTLTPFGFQSERRTLWEAPDIYTKLSPFMVAHKIKEPLLLIHGEKDNNPGTFPIQSERLYHAVKGNGGNVRFVSLPHESHGYAARESVEHTLHEMLAWFDQHVKNAK